MDAVDRFCQSPSPSCHVVAHAVEADLVKVLKEDNALSCWTLKTEQFGQAWELTWVARNLDPIPNRKALPLSPIDLVEWERVRCFVVDDRFIGNLRDHRRRSRPAERPWR